MRKQVVIVYFAAERTSTVDIKAHSDKTILLYAVHFRQVGANTMNLYSFFVAFERVRALDLRGGVSA